MAGNNTAIVAINPRTGEILAMVGSRDFNNTDIDGQVNVAISERAARLGNQAAGVCDRLSKGLGPGDRRRRCENVLDRERPDSEGMVPPELRPEVQRQDDNPCRHGKLHQHSRGSGARVRGHRHCEGAG